MASRPRPQDVLPAGLCGQLSVAASGVLPPAALPVSVALLVGCALAGASAGAARAVRLRRVATAVCLGLVAVAVPALGSTGDPAGLRAVLGPLLVGVQAMQALLWQTRRDLQVGLLVAVGLLVLGASYAPDVVAGLPLLAGWAACLWAGAALVRLREVEGVDVAAVPTGVPTDERPAAGARAPSLLPSTALAVALGLVVFLLVPVPKDAGLHSRLGAAAASAQGGSRAGALGGGPLDMRVRGALSERPLAQVAGDSPALWRGAVYGAYDGATWSVVGGRPRPLTGPPYVLGPAAGTLRRDEVTLLGPSATLWAPGEPVSVDGLFADPPGAAQASATPPGQVGLGPGVTSYTVTTRLQPTDPGRLRAAAGPGEADPRWLQLPSGLPQRVRSLAGELTAAAPTRYDAVLAVQGWLAGHATYRLDSPVPAAGEDAVDRFLFVDRAGFCEQFAAAETVLLRAAGIPARLVTGLAYGVPAGRDRTFREKDLHAWVEVSYDGVGWSPSDPTAGTALDAAGSSVRARLSAALAGGLRRLDDLPGGRPALATALLLALGAVALAGRRRSRATGPTTLLWPWPVRRRRQGRAGPQRPRRRWPGRRTGRPRPDTTTGTGVSEVLDAFLRLDARLGAYGRRPCESVAEMAHRLRLTGAQADAFDAVQRECYAPPPVPVAGAVEVLERMATGPGAGHG